MTYSSGDVSMNDKECEVVTQWNGRLYDSLLPPWSGL